MYKKQWFINGLLLLTAILWGLTMAVQRLGAAYVSPFTFNAVRCFLSFAVLIPIIYAFGRCDKTAVTVKADVQGKRTLLTGGILCGFFLFGGANLQQMGLVTTAAGKTGFISSLYIVLVPLLGLFFHKKVGRFVWLGVGLSLTGLYLLCAKGGLAFATGDFIVLAATIFFAGQIICAGIYAPKVDVLKLAALQFLFCSLFSSVIAILFEHNTLENILACAIPILYAGVMVGGIGFTCQIVAQKNTDATIVSVILSLESVFSALSGYFLLGETLSPVELWGCFLMFSGAIVAQKPEKKRCVSSETQEKEGYYAG